MSTTPQATQTRRVIPTADGGVLYEITTQITDKGDLPFKDLFVLSISDGNDPKDDVLARIATPLDIRQADPSSPKYVRVVATDLITIPPDTFASVANMDEITELPRDRTTAVRAGKTTYLSSVMVVTYNSLTTADAAYKQILQRLSDLVTAWRAVYTPFATAPTQAYSLPTSGSSVENERIAAYKAARTVRISAEAARDAARAAKDACVRDCAADKIIYNFLVEDVAFLEQARLIVLAITEASIPPGTPTTTNVKDFVLKQGAYVSDPNSYQTLLTAKRTSRDDYAARVSACEVNCQALSAQLLNTQATVDGARAAERDALANVYAVCPTFDPSTV